MEQFSKQTYDHISAHQTVGFENFHNDLRHGHGKTTRLRYNLQIYICRFTDRYLHVYSPFSSLFQLKTTFLNLNVISSQDRFRAITSQTNGTNHNNFTLLCFVEVYPPVLEKSRVLRQSLVVNPGFTNIYSSHTDQSAIFMISFPSAMEFRKIGF